MEELLTAEERKKFRDLKEYLTSLGSVAIAFSGGVDSTFLLKTAHDCLGDKCIAVTASTCFFPERESSEAKLFCEKEGIRQVICAIDALQIPELSENPKNRCYICKRALFKTMMEAADREGVRNIAEGSNMDDRGDYRPGLLAVKELGVKSPLSHCNLYKSEIRDISKALNLSTFDKPSFACLASRFVYGEKITEEKLAMVDQAEQILLDMGFKQFRVRIHQTLARIEVLPEEFDHLMEKENRERIYSTLKKIGFSYVTLDLSGYRTGSMNETLENI